MNNISTKGELDRLFEALNDQLSLVTTSYDLIVIGGSALLALDIVDRPTRDVDVVAIGSLDGPIKAKPLPQDLVAAIEKVASDFDMDPKWLNPGPADLLTWGLPQGFEKRLVERSYGQFLTIRFASRYDQIHFKLYALVDRGPGRHEDDLIVLKPSDEELLEAARWTTTQDPSEGFRQILAQALEHLGVEDADSRI